MLGRLFCFNGGGDWASHQQYGELARARVLEVVEEELEERYAALAHHHPPLSARASQTDAAHMRRLYKANLPTSEMSLCKELLRKLAAIDGAREAAEVDQQQLHAQLKVAEAAHRQAEFARARAEAIATARGEALMHAQQATRDAELQQMQLAEMLKAALPQLGIDPSPLLLTHTQSPALLPQGSGGADVSPHPGQSCMFTPQQLAAVAESISRLPPQPRGSVPVQQQEVLAQRRWEEERQHSREQEQELPRSSQADSAGAPQLSGFTVYTNGLQEPGDDESDGPEVEQGEVAQVARQQPSAPPSPLNSQGSGVAWRSISSAALSSRSTGSVAAEDEAAAAAGRGAHRQPHGSQAGSRGSSRHRSQHQAAEPADQQQGHRRLQRGQHLPQLVLPDLDGSQMDSLVRIGASMQSPDPYAAAAVAAEMLLQDQQAAAGQWDSSANPLLSHTGSEKYLRELQEEMQRHGPPGPGRASRPGSSRTSLEGGHEAHAAGEQALAPDAAAGGGARKLAAPLPLHQLYAEGSKYPGAGTWVSPSLAAMLAHKKGYNPLLDGGEPSPPSHIKAVFGTREDKEFYGPMAAHLNKCEPHAAVQQQQAPQRAPQQAPPHVSVESVRGPQRQPPSSNPGSMHGSADQDRRQPLPQMKQQQQQQHAHQAQPLPVSRAALQHSMASAAAAAAGSRGSSRTSSRNVSRNASPQRLPQQVQLQPPPERRQAAFMNRFQPMGMSAQQSVDPAPSQQQQQQQQRQGQGGPRRSSFAVSDLGGASQRHSNTSADEGLAAAAGLSKAALRTSGLPPRQQQHQPAAAAQLATKRSLDSMRESIGGGAAAANISTSMHAVEAAMAALRDANPHLRAARAAAAAAPQQQQQLAQKGTRATRIAAAAAAARGTTQHTRTHSLPDSDLDLPLHELRSSLEQRREQQQRGTGALARQPSR